MDYQSNKYNPHSFDSKAAQFFLMGIAVVSTSLTMFYLDGISSKDVIHRRGVLQFTEQVRALIYG